MSPNDDDTRLFQAPVKSGPEQLVGTVIAGRQIQQLLGVGAMGAVYLAKHLKMGRLEAFKVLHDKLARDPDAMARFDRGARNISLIRHHNVCTIYDFSDTDTGLQFVAMEYVEGEALKDLLDREGPLPVDRAVRIGIQTAEALQSAHNVNVIHRDLKPANIMIARGHKGDDVVKVVDFDISKAAGDTEEKEVTQLGYVVGTPEYMSPEQLWGGKLDGRSDVYSLALVMYRILTGRLPFRGDTLQEVMNSRLTDAPLLRLDELAPGKTFPAELQEILIRALHRKAEERTASAGEFAEQLRALQPAPATRVGPIPTTVVEPATQRPAVAPAGSKLKMALVAVGVAGVAIAGMLVAKNGNASTETPAEEQANNDSLRNSGQWGVGGAPLIDTLAPTSTSERQAARDVGGRSSTPTRTPASTPVTEPPKPAPALSAEQAAAILSAQRDRLAQATKPDPAVLVAMRDSAATIYAIAAMPTAQKARAAFIAGQTSLHLNDKGGCTLWATRARDLEPARSGYQLLLTSCASMQ